MLGTEPSLTHNSCVFSLHIRCKIPESSVLFCGKVCSKHTQLIHQSLTFVNTVSKMQFYHVLQYLPVLSLFQ